MKYKLIEACLRSHEPRGFEETVFDDYEKLVEYINDEHYADGVCPKFAVVSSDRNGKFPNTEAIEQVIYIDD